MEKIESDVSSIYFDIYSEVLRDVPLYLPFYYGHSNFYMGSEINDLNIERAKLKYVKVSDDFYSFLREQE
ncbi:MAG: hypothetical protein DRQ88_08075 [Epsilonproteobacteria bacterium]|nr:MAG: hypothetical protein DRQ89_09095 [Campylobacterota bacterium]RLA66009.1 MAG: hypothetical protein DRQ88_08075 [Campylobacterota bacterium]